VLLIGIGSVAVGISPLVATDSSVEMGDPPSISEGDSGAKKPRGVSSHTGISSSGVSQMGFQ